MDNLINKIKRQNKLDIIRSQIFSRYYININYDINNTILISGTARSGTTFISDLINYKNEYRLIFEPFNPQKVKICNNFKIKQYIRPNCKDTKYFEPTKLILSGRIRNYWIDHQNKLFVSDKRIVKDIRTNLMLKWISNNFSNMPIILIIRHPCAVAHSKIKMGWKAHLEQILYQQNLINDYLSEYLDGIKSIKSNFEQHILIWCIENCIPLKQFKKDEIFIVFYEELCLNPKNEIDLLFKYINKKYDIDIFKKMKKPSTMSQDNTVIDGENLINKWKKNISKEQIKKALEILNLFNLDKIYLEDTMPIVESKKNLFNMY